LASVLFASASLGGGWSAGAYQQIVKNMQKNFSSIHKPPASIRFALIKHTLAVSVEPFKFSPAEPVAYELSYMRCKGIICHFVSQLGASRYQFHTTTDWPGGLNSSLTFNFNP